MGWLGGYSHGHQVGEEHDEERQVQGSPTRSCGASPGLWDHRMHARKEELGGEVEGAKEVMIVSAMHYGVCSKRQQG